jgi:hypothetical protein
LLLLLYWSLNSGLARQVLYQLGHIPDLFRFSYFSDRVYLWTVTLPISTSSIAGITGMYHHTQHRFCVFSKFP